LNVFALSLPPLRDRRDDIPPLVDFFVDVFNETMRKSVEGPATEALAQLQAYDWPGNVRELRNVIERAMVLTRGDRIESAALPFDLRAVAPGPGRSLPGAMMAPSQSMSISQSGITNRSSLTDSSVDLSSSSADMKEARKALERKMILDALKACAGNISAASRELGLQRKTLHRKIEAFGIDMREFGKGRETLERDQVVKTLKKLNGSISAAARELGVPRTTLYRTIELYGIDPGDIRASASFPSG
jgi:two-component system, NtrC family, response regulator AtoC